MLDSFLPCLRPMKNDVAFVKQKLNLFVFLEKGVRGGENSHVNAKSAKSLLYEIFEIKLNQK